MRLQSAIFDMDGTLLDSMPVWDNLSANLLREWGVEPEENLSEKLNQMTVRQGAAYCKERYGLSRTVDEIEDAVHGRVEDFYRNKVQAKPGVKKFLSLLKMEGVWMYVATNTERTLAEAALKHAGIDGYFRGLMTCGEAGASKSESPEIYERCLRRLRSTKKDTVVFEDALHAIQTARDAGFRVCGVYDPSSEADQETIRQLSEYYIRSFEEMFESQTLE